MKIFSHHISVYIQSYENKMFIYHGIFQLFFIIANMLYLIPANSENFILFRILYHCTGLEYYQGLGISKYECLTQS